MEWGTVNHLPFERGNSITWSPAIRIIHELAHQVIVGVTADFLHRALRAAVALHTHSGRLMLKCYPTNDAVLHLRRTLTLAMPQLAIHVPRMVHVKLGHLMVPLSDGQLREFVAWLRKIELHACYSMIFRDLYTPQGRIKL